MYKVEWPIAQMNAITRKVKGRILTFATMFCQDLNNEMVIATPVRFGFLRGSWFSGLNGPPDGVGSQDPSGGDTMAELNQVALTLTIGDIYYLVNTAVYAARMEYGFFGKDKLGRNIHQEPRGFVRGVLARVNQIGRETATRVASGQYDA